MPGGAGFLPSTVVVIPPNIMEMMSFFTELPAVFFGVPKFESMHPAEVHESSFRPDFVVKVTSRQ